MFSKKDKNDLNTVTILNSLTKFTGDIVSDENIRIDGHFSGTIFSKSRVVVGSSAFIHGNIHAINAEISGNINGNIVVENLLTMKSTAKILGDVISKKLIIEEGAEFSGIHKIFDAKLKAEFSLEGC